MAEIAPCEPDLPKSHPELFHYTTLNGLRGISRSRTLWATHYSTLNDSGEVTFVQKALTIPIANRLTEIIKQAQREKFTIRRNVQKLGGLKAAATVLSEEVLSVVHRAAFESVGGPIIADPYITSFCSHAEDEEYERSHGLLSQWRGYGGAGGYCIVFDTLDIINLLRRESHRHFWSYMNVDAVTYSNDEESIEQHAAEITKYCQQCAEVLLSSVPPASFDDLLLPYLQAATHIKHRGFIEEREVRIVACPITRQQIDASIESVKASFAKRQLTSPDATFKNIYNAVGMQNRRYVTLFDSLQEHLPIKRVIVGPSLRQQENFTIAAKLLGGKIKVRCSETPFTGQGKDKQA